MNVPRRVVRDHLAGFLSLALSLALVVSFLSVAGWPAFQDFGEWIYQGYSGAWLVTMHKSSAVTFVSHPVPYVLGQGILSVLNIALSPLAAGVAYTVLYLVGGAVAVDLLVRKYSLRPIVSAVFFTMTIVLSSGFWNGYIGNQLGLVLLAFLLTLPRRWVVAPGGVLVGSLLAFGAHGLVYAVWGLAALVFAIEAKRVVAFVVGVAPSLGLVAWYLVASAEPGGSGDMQVSGLLPFVGYKAYTLSKFGGYQNFQVGGTGDADVLPVLYWAGVASNVLVGLMLVVLAAQIVSLRRWLLEERRAEFVILCVLVLIAAVSPAFALGIVNPGERILGAVLLLGGVLTLGDNDRGGRLAATVTSGLLVLGALLTLISALAMPLKHSVPTGRTEAPRGSESRTQVLYGHRTDFFAEAAYYAAEADRQGVRPERPLAWETSFLRSAHSDDEEAKD